MAVLSMPCFRALWKTVFVKGDIVYYESSDFLETADSDTLKQIASTRELTRKYYFSDYGDTEKRTSILRELLGGIGKMWQSTRLFIATMEKIYFWEMM